MNRPIAIALAVGLGTGALGMGPSQAQSDCAKPTVNALTNAEAAVSRPAVASPSEIALSNVYAFVEQATLTQFTYAEAGPQNIGVFEALAPPGSPPPPRAVSAYPSEDIPDSDTEEWGGVSRTAAGPNAASASSTSTGAVGAGSATAKSARSFVTTLVECDVVTVIAGWEMNDVVLAPGVTAEQLGETVTLIVGPDGSSADTDTTVVGVEGAEVEGQGRPADPLTDPTHANGGPRLEAGQARTEASDDGASVTGGGFHFFQADPETGQGAGYSFGATKASIEVLGAITPVRPVAPAVTGTTTPPPTQPPRVLGESTGRPVSVGTDSAAVGSVPEVPEAALSALQQIQITDDLISVVTVERRTWFPLLAVLGVVGTIGALASGVVVGRSQFPTLDWIADRTVRNSARFNAVYLKW